MLRDRNMLILEDQPEFLKRSVVGVSKLNGGDMGLILIIEGKIIK